MEFERDSAKLSAASARPFPLANHIDPPPPNVMFIYKTYIPEGTRPYAMFPLDCLALSTFVRFDLLDDPSCVVEFQGLIAYTLRIGQKVGGVKSESALFKFYFHSKYVSRTMIQFLEK